MNNQKEQPKQVVATKDQRVKALLKIAKSLKENEGAKEKEIKFDENVFGENDKQWLLTTWKKKRNCFG